MAGEVERRYRKAWPLAVAAIATAVALSIVHGAQIESVETATPPQYVWVSHGRVEGHLALTYSPAGAFSPDSSTLATVIDDKIVLMDLRAADVRKVLQPRLEGVAELDIQSANYLTPNRLFVLGSGLFRSKDRESAPRTPRLAFQWDANQDALFGKVNAVCPRGGCGPPRYFPQVGYLAMYKDSNFDLWQPASGQGGRINIPSLTQHPHLFEISPDGHWLLLAQIETDSTADPAVIQLSEHRFVDSLRGHQGTVLGFAFSRDSKKVVTACEDGKARIWSVPEWKLLRTLAGHQGPVHWAEFSPYGKWVATAGEDKTARIWSADDGSLVQTLAESSAPLRTVAFAPSGEYVAASGEEIVLVWQRTLSGK